ncbi:PREDICTED: alcohol-forming fatty acyl-CoA reductase-like [Nelumbo nucifera]|uniref:Fatty acyl-CoA reductase n=2 Tax=Nelumbo nucifera TaxID=4432 RepID=A0A1U8B739_NELNU|nr:PREDICTED: alcohol-forming fatty acyl-CoA reductase-like [Nelumbo nucifera]DAD28782.1 TPA_asm: hypothetical protein HUJ06_030250 [Nelumbo nucifera]
MELVGILESLENKTILVTGATGFVAKIFVEKVLRVQPNVKKLYLLLRAPHTKSAIQRLHNEVLGKEVFRVLRQKLGSGFDSFMSEKVIPVPGDITCKNLGVEETDLRDKMWREVDIVVNIAATVNFDERYDDSLFINTMGAKHVLEFAKKCSKLQIFVHVSTAYVGGQQEGLMLEKPYQMGETLNGTLGLDIQQELKVAEERLKELQAEKITIKEERIAMKELGLKRARLYGWPNTYAFTKAMGEMLLGHYRENIPLVIIRPTIITSTYNEPFPGWIEGVRTIDSLILGYGKGRLTGFPGDPKLIMDVIPGDMVVNSIIVAMVAHLNHSSEFIYHVGSSVRHPAQFAMLRETSYRYFSVNPCMDSYEKPVKVGRVEMLSTMDDFRRYMAIRYLIPLKVLQVLNMAFCQYFKGIYGDLKRKINFVMRLVELYEPYLYFKGVFDDLNTEMLRKAALVNYDDASMFQFDPKCINWENYFMNIHFPGLVKYVFK